MNPLIKENTLVIASILPYIFRSPAINDIVIVKHPYKNLKIIKRISNIKHRQYFVIGDNSQKSTDSRNFGFINEKLILAKVIFK